MPIYEYKCISCGNIDEHLESINDNKISICSSCGAESNRKISAGSFQYKSVGGGCSSADSGNSKCSSCPMAQG